jgi:hypothetical protein
MTKRQKLLDAIRNNPTTVRFDDACKAAEMLGFIKKAGKGSHCVYAKKSESVHLNFQNRNGYVYPYQARQLIEMINKYED